MASSIASRLSTWSTPLTLQMGCRYWYPNHRNNLWANAANKLSEVDKRNINFSCPDKRKIVAELLQLARSSEQEAINKRWRYTRKKGEIVILRDVFAKIIHWVDLFKQVGDQIVQHDPGHAALPWAGVRFILQVSANPTVPIRQDGLAETYAGCC